MNLENSSLMEDPEILVQKFSKKLDDIRLARHQIEGEFLTTDSSLNDFISSTDAVIQRLKTKKTEPRKPAAVAPTEIISVSPPAAPAAPAAGQAMTLEDFKTHMGSILQGSLEAATDKISNRIQGMLKELKNLSGPAREAKYREIQQAAEFEMVDISMLYKHEQVQSNLGEIGVDEKESKSIDANLERLRKMRGLKPKKE
ncbi:MAG: hypothetical protein HQL25_08760 [Candidatus Omnitrophica bacterium]|nr:hypothetical protein [Candidatus Omnitrophota bacterium]